METGDLCADTAPTTKSKACHDPGAVNDTCGFTTFQNTPYNNYMSYTGTTAFSSHSVSKNKSIMSQSISTECILYIIW